MSSKVHFVCHNFKLGEESVRLGGIPVFSYITVIFYYRDGFICNFLHN